ncbi:hypothetical protein GCM10027290_22040 [Micromonospora sonneratiae]|uniref:DUF4190 domain-containing protein n=1 Tax=Micromonospora sonneratiae TaxID=1184706 RepID=A0ABW3YDA6_9ACTN
MTYPQQPGGDPSWSDPQPTMAYPDAGYPVGKSSGMDAPPVPTYPVYGYTPAPPTNGMAIAALVLSLVGLASCITAPIGAILGHVARKQIRERGEGGDGLALAGIIVGWILTGLFLLVIAFYVVLIVWAINAGSSMDSGTTY